MPDVPRKKRQKLNNENNSQAIDLIGHVPNGVEEQIFSFIDTHHLFKLSLVSKSFFAIASPILWKRRLLNYLAKQALGFIENQYVFENLETADIKKLLLSIVELDRSITMGNDEFTYSRPISQETLDFLYRNRTNVVAGYYYCCYATSSRNTANGKVKIEQKEINELLNSIAEKNPAAYFLLAAHQIHPSIDCENRFENFKKGLKKLKVTLTKENWDTLEKQVNSWLHLNRYFFRPLQFFREKTELKYSNETLNWILAAGSDKLFLIINALIHQGWMGTIEKLQSLDAFTSNIYNANRVVLEFLQGKFYYQATTLRLLSHPLFGDKFIQKLKLSQQQGREENPEAAMFNLLNKINETSKELLVLFDKYPNLIDKYEVPEIAKMDSTIIDKIMKQCDPTYEKPKYFWDKTLPSNLPQEHSKEITQWFLESLKNPSSESDEDSDHEFNFS